MELSLLLCCALAQIMAHQLVTQVLHRVWCLRQIIYQATHPYGCWCVRLQIHNLVGLKNWANIGGGNWLFCNSNSYILENLLLHQLILSLQLFNLLLQLLTQVDVRAISSNTSCLTNLWRRTWLSYIDLLCWNIIGWRYLNMTLWDCLSLMRRLTLSKRLKWYGTAVLTQLALGVC